MTKRHITRASTAGGEASLIAFHDDPEAILRDQRRLARSQAPRVILRLKGRVVGRNRGLLKDPPRPQTPGFLVHEVPPQMAPTEENTARSRPSMASTASSKHSQKKASSAGSASISNSASTPPAQAPQPAAPMTINQYNFTTLFGRPRERRTPSLQSDSTNSAASYRSTRWTRLRLGSVSEEEFIEEE